MQVRGKKNLVISKDLAGPVGLFVKFSVLQEYGVDRVFLLENANVDLSQRNVVFLVHAEKVHQVATVAGKSIIDLQQTRFVAYQIYILINFLSSAYIMYPRLPFRGRFFCKSSPWDNSRLRRSLIPTLRDQSCSLD